MQRELFPLSNFLLTMATSFLPSSFFFPIKRNRKSSKLSLHRHLRLLQLSSIRSSLYEAILVFLGRKFFFCFSTLVSFHLLLHASFRSISVKVSSLLFFFSALQSRLYLCFLFVISTIIILIITKRKSSRQTTFHIPRFLFSILT